MPQTELEAGTVKLNAYVEDKIGFPGKYSSVTIGASVTRLVPEAADDVLQFQLADNFTMLEAALAVERAKVLEEIQEK